MPKSGYCITTYKLRLYTNYKSYFKVTQERYNALVSRFYRICLRYRDILDYSNTESAKKLLALTGISKDGEIGKEYFEIKLPRELKRTAAGQAVQYAKIYFADLERSKENKNVGTPTKARKFDFPVTYWKDMRKQIDDNGNFQFKVCTRRDGWRFRDAKIKDWDKLKGLEVLSPTIVIKKDYIMAHIPVRHQIEDVTPVRDRLEDENIKVCGVAFSNSNNFAICTILNSKGEFQKALFVSGGNEYRHRTKCILNKIYRDKCRIRRLADVKNDHSNCYKKLHNLSEYYAHDVSKKIVQFCKENDAQIIAMMDLTIYDPDKSYYYRKKIQKYTPIYLSSKIKEYLKYKSFKEGILVKFVSSNNVASKCYKCNGKIKRGRDELKISCENGHNTDYFFNSSINIGRECLSLKK